MKTRIVIDPNIRVRGGQTYAGFEDIQGLAIKGAPVEVVEPEAGLVGVAVITDLDHDKQLVYLAVDWRSLHATQPAEPARGIQKARALLDALMDSLATTTARFDEVEVSAEIVDPPIVPDRRVAA